MRLLWKAIVSTATADRKMDVEVRKAKEQGRHISYFGAEANDFGALENCFANYAEHGSTKIRKYLHTFDEAVPFNQLPGTFTPWQEIRPETDLLFYEGLHGGVVTDNHNVAQHVDLLIGMVPIINLEWIQKIMRDTSERGHSREAVMSSIVRSMDDYINHITPQFSRTPYQLPARADGGHLQPVQRQRYSIAG